MTVWCAGLVEASSAGLGWSSAGLDKTGSAALGCEYCRFGKDWFGRVGVGVVQVWIRLVRPRWGGSSAGLDETGSAGLGWD